MSKFGFADGECDVEALSELDYAIYERKSRRLIMYVAEVPESVDGVKTWNAEGPLMDASDSECVDHTCGKCPAKGKLFEVATTKSTPTEYKDGDQLTIYVLGSRRGFIVTLYLWKNSGVGTATIY